MLFSKLHLQAAPLLGLLTGALGQTCWRNTTCSGPKTAAFPGPWDANIYAPSSRNVQPRSILSLATGTVISDYTGTATLKGNGSALVFDFGIEVGGILTFTYKSSGTGSVGIAFTEAKNWIGYRSDDSNGSFKQGDGAIYANFTAAGTYHYVMPDDKLRGGFRYLTLYLLDDSGSATATVDLSSISLEIGFAPTWSNLRAYQGYFNCSDPLLTRIWYAGAYTLQTNAVPVNTGRWVPMLAAGWANNGTLGPGDTIIVDGAKRDRAVWPGDMGVAVPSAFVSLGDLDSVRNALQVMFNYQQTTGAFPEAGPPLLQKGSDTYHMWTMIGTYNYVLYSADFAFLKQNWDGYLRAMDYIYGEVNGVGLLNVTGIRDWARWQQGFNNTEANMILYHTLITGSSLATWNNNSTLSSLWTSRAAALKTAINRYCFDSSRQYYRDNATMTALYPQDANSLSLLYSIAPANSTDTISEQLTHNWTPIGAETPELPGNISPFISSFELQGHFVVGHAERALELIRRCWGWYANHPNGTGSTVIEGYLTNGSFSYRSSRGYSYDPSYVSHSHGWSSGPTSALTNFIVGLEVTAPAGSGWKLQPTFADLTSAEAGFTTSLGKYWSSWTLNATTTVITFQAPSGTEGVVTVDQKGKKVQMYLDDKPVSASDYAKSNGDLDIKASGGVYKLVLTKRQCVKRPTAKV